MGQRLRHIIGDQFGAAIVEQTLEKAVQAAKERAGKAQTQFYDPVSMFMGREWVTRMNAPLTPNDLRAMATNPIIGSIVQTRINQVAAFCQPRTSAYDIGFEVKPVDQKMKSGKADVPALTNWIYNSGLLGHGDGSLETFARKFIRDSLVLDQACAEIVNARDGSPAYMVTVDAATIKRLQASMKFDAKPSDPLYAQVVDDVILAQYTSTEMIFGVRNPQTDIRFLGYGTSELEWLLRTVTSILNAEKYNSGQLTQGGTQKGLLVVKGDVDNDQFDVFKRDFREVIRNAATNWRPPVLRVSKEADVDWLSLDRANRDMEYSALFDFLVKQACGVYQIDPTEINWSIGQAGATVNFESTGDTKQVASRQKGLKPLLTFLANQMNLNVIQRLDERFRMEFIGLEYDRKTDVDIAEKEGRTFKMVDELREERGLRRLPGGKGQIILNTVFAQMEAPEQDPPGGELIDIQPDDSPSTPTKNGKDKGKLEIDEKADTDSGPVKEEDKKAATGKAKDPLKGKNASKDS